MIKLSDYCSVNFSKMVEVANQICRNVHDAEDIVQDAIVELLSDHNVELEEHYLLKRIESRAINFLKAKDAKDDKNWRGCYTLTTSL